MAALIQQRSPTYFTLTNIRYRGENYIKLNSFPDTKSFRNGTFAFKSSFTNIEAVIDHFPDAVWEGDAKKKLESYFAFKIEEKTKILVKDSQMNSERPMEAFDYAFKTKPFDHQLRAFNASRSSKEYGLFFEQGCGKTKVIIDTARYLYDIDEITTLIVIAPNGVHDNWVDEELPLHMPGQYEAAAWRASFKKKQKEKWEEVKKSEGVLKVLAFNVDAFRSQRVVDEIAALLENEKCLLAVDESQKIKNPKAKRTKAIIKFGRLAAYRRILTGTPITKGAEDFYSQFKFLNPNIIGITAFSGFKNRYCVMGGWEMRAIVSYKNIDDLQEKVKNHSIRVLKKDCLDLPEKIYKSTPFDLSKKQLELINQIKKEGLAAISAVEEDAIVLDHVITRLTKIQQISNGYFYDTENKKVIEIVAPNKNPRLLALKESLSQIEGKVIIWTNYTEDIKLISKMLPAGSYVIYDGTISSDERKANKEAFQKDTRIKYFLVNSRAGHTGLTLTQSHYSIYHSNNYDLEIRLQSEDRNHRIGTKFNVVYEDLIASKTADRKIINALKTKKSISDLILQDPASMFLESEDE